MKQEDLPEIEYTIGTDPNPEYPGIGGQQFKVVINKDYFAPIELPELQVEITKVYKQTWWRKLLFRLGFNVSFYETKMVKKMTHVPKCNSCGKFIKYSDISSGLCASLFIPDSDVSYEEDLVHCKTCTEKYGKPISLQQFIA